MNPESGTYGQITKRGNSTPNLTALNVDEALGIVTPINGNRSYVLGTDTYYYVTIVSYMVDLPTTSPPNIFTLTAGDGSRASWASVVVGDVMYFQTVQDKIYFYPSGSKPSTNFLQDPDTNPVAFGIVLANNQSTDSTITVRFIQQTGWGAGVG